MSERIRAVALKELTYLPIETRDDPDVPGKQWAALRGLHNAGLTSSTRSAVSSPRPISVWSSSTARPSPRWSGSEKGFVDESWRRFLASLPVARSVAKLGYSFDRAKVEPTYIQPLLLDAAEPSDGEIEGILR